MGKSHDLRIPAIYYLTVRPFDSKEQQLPVHAIHYSKQFIIAQSSTPLALSSSFISYTTTG